VVRFFLYGTAAGLVFGKLYLPNQEPLAATLSAFGTYFIGFAARPIGAAIFGHYDDGIGRKATLIATLVPMGIATFLIAFVPTYESIGIWGGDSLDCVACASGNRRKGANGADPFSWRWSGRARTASAGWLPHGPQFGVPAGLFLANLAVFVFSAWTGDQFITWGWRIPFALSIILIAIGLWIRLGILETPLFQRHLVSKTHFLSSKGSSTSVASIGR
jgi:MFS family permease